MISSVTCALIHDDPEFLPANGRTGHCRNNPRLKTTEESSKSVSALDDRHRLPKTFGGSNLRISRCATRLQQRLNYIQGSGNPSGDRAGQPSRDTVRGGVVAFRGIHHLRDGLVCGKLDGGKGDCHR